MYVIREPVHENDRRFRPRAVSKIDPVLVPLNKSLLVGHHYLGRVTEQIALERRVRLLRPNLLAWPSRPTGIGESAAQ